MNPASHFTASNSKEVQVQPVSEFSELEKIRPAPYFARRAWIDRFSALLLCIPGIPLMILVALLLKLTSSGPILYRQRRVGKNGRVFTLLKFRTMIPNAEKNTGPVWTSINDPRITRVGRFLRPTHLDELPQLFNVLLGHMALIGPRPERPEFTQLLAREIHGYEKRSLITPGITGLAQINLPPDTDLDSVRRKLTLDLEYICTGSFFLDFRIFICTFLRLFAFPGSVCARWTGIVREPVVPEYMKINPVPDSSSPAAFNNSEEKKSSGNSSPERKIPALYSPEMEKNEDSEVC